MIRSFIFIVVLLSIPVSSFAQISRAEVQSRIKTCEAIGYNPALADPCFQQIAVEKQDPKICDRIFWASQRVSCKRQVQYQHVWTPGVVLPKIPFVLFAIAFIYYVFSNPPRTSYLYGSAIGAAFAGFQIAVAQGSVVQLEPVQPYLHLLQAPVTGLMTYAPFTILQLPNTALLVLVHVLFYGLVLGFHFQGEYHTRRKMLFWTLYACILTFWSHPQFDSIRIMIETMPVIGWQ